jgi:hypothetical protein
MKYDIKIACLKETRTFNKEGIPHVTMDTKEFEYKDVELADLKAIDKFVKSKVPEGYELTGTSMISRDLVESDKNFF